MSCRFLKASSYYPSALRWFYARYPLAGDLPYAEQHAALMRASIAWSDSWQRHLEATSRFQAQELVINAEPLQKKWAMENGINYTEGNWAADIFFAQCAKFKPDILFAHAHYILTDWWGDSRARSLERAFVIGYDGTAKHLPALAEHCDLVLTCVRRSVATYVAMGARCHHFPYGFETDVLSRLEPKIGAKPELAFIGSIDVSTGHGRRARDLAALSRALPLRLWLTHLPRNDLDLARRFASLAKRRAWAGMAGYPMIFPAIRRLMRKNEGELFGVDMFSTLASSRIALNIHIDVARGEAANMRLFEATGVGTCLMTDWKPNIADFFEPGREVVTFKSVSEAVEKARYLLDHDQERLDIAHRGQARTLREHATGDRIRSFAEQLLAGC
jgi:hypothetical protein